MEQLNPAALARILDILHHAKDMTLATIRPDGFPQATTVSYVHDGLAIYTAVGLGSQKADNIQRNDKVSATVNLDYADWNSIRGISLAGTAEFVQGQEHIESVAQMFLYKFPAAKSMAQAAGPAPWQGLLFLRILPTVISLLDYRHGFGHTELYAVSAADRYAGSTACHEK
ncbi:pyridoxamine 5'-phosphate oxidase family protein [Pseudoduganella ginsengisoli]|uniref:Pyridoxamine 5'-phosphate oxidase family protein n=1 Tax=Pseudoduganella ginsengisoli TaxID=1462440 RepID=A0A6L6Q5R4_9BURK|nr:pyridoxamine 5'-phosphate oxidase family protein [Pseudoduganella ginsengisoli]MTW04618.1 pyridoxamine 5'-phosphate oxidase family protein [Pseudoduganella ginsengisoli]